MCNLYSITTNQAAIIALIRVVNRYVGNLAPMPGELVRNLPVNYSRDSFEFGVIWEQCRGWIESYCFIAGRRCCDALHIMAG
jgi:hypothetical protein